LRKLRVEIPDRLPDLIPVFSRDSRLWRPGSGTKPLVGAANSLIRETSGDFCN
jgi:hypothetical protein